MSLCMEGFLIYHGFVRERRVFFLFIVAKRRECIRFNIIEKEKMDRKIDEINDHCDDKFDIEIR